MSEPIQTDAIERHGLTVKVVPQRRGYRGNGVCGWIAVVNTNRHGESEAGDECPTPAAAINSLNQKLKEREKDNG